jgi:CheY-like chemotaxis protein
MASQLVESIDLGEPASLPQPQAEVRCLARRILIVDGNPEQASILAAGLEKQGYETLCVRSGQAALEAAERNRPRLVVMDLRLPDMDGLRVCERLADGSTTCGVPIILLSGMTRPDIIRCSRAAGCKYYVRKPYDPNALLTLIQHSLGRTRRFDP